MLKYGWICNLSGTQRRFFDERNQIELHVVDPFVAYFRFDHPDRLPGDDHEYRRISARSKDLLSQAPGGADDFIIVDCVLPGQIRQLGTGMMYISRGPSKKLTAEECATRGGEFAIPGQSDYTRALMVWHARC